MLCTVFNNSICCHGELIKKCSLWKESKIKWLIYEPVPLCLCHLSSLNAWLSCLSCFITHTPSCCVLIVTGLYPETQDRLTMVDWQVCCLLPGYSALSFFATAYILQLRPTGCWVFFVINNVASVLHLTCVHVNHSRIQGPLLVTWLCASRSHDGVSSGFICPAACHYFALSSYQHVLDSTIATFSGVINWFLQIFTGLSYWWFYITCFITGGSQILTSRSYILQLWDMFWGWFLLLLVWTVACLRWAAREWGHELVS